MVNEAVDIAPKLSLSSERWSPKVVGRLNDYAIKVVKIQGEFAWHTHDDTDELFIVVSGELTIQLRDGDVRLGLASCSSYREASRTARSRTARSTPC